MNKVIIPSKYKNNSSIMTSIATQTAEEIIENKEKINFNYVMIGCFAILVTVIIIFIYIESSKQKDPKKRISYSRNKKEFYNSIPLIIPQNEFTNNAILQKTQLPVIEKIPAEIPPIKENQTEKPPTKKILPAEASAILY
jgi:hypothetical protein